MLTEQKIPLGQYIAAFVEWLTQHGANYFDAIASTLETMRVRNVSKRFGAFTALDSVSLEVAAGELVCQIGRAHV